MKYLILACLLALAGLIGCQPSVPSTITGDQKTMEKVVTRSGLAYIDEVIGTGAEPKTGDKVTVHYIGMFTDGRKFDSSFDRNKPFTFTIGLGQVIKGWDEGVATMKVGGKRKLMIPANLGYGSRGTGGVIPPNAELVFDIELLGIQ